MTSAEAIWKTRQVARRQHKSLATEEAYVFWLRKYMAAIRQMPNELPSEEKLERFLTELAVVKDVAASTQNQAFNAIVYFYKDVLKMPLKRVDSLRATRPKNLRRAPSVEETRKLLAEVKDVGGYPTNLIVRLMYGCGFRVGESLSIRIKELQIEQSRILILGGKGGVDRVVRLPCALVAELQQQIEVARVTWKRDQLNKLPIQLPHQLARKYPEMEWNWQWAWVFPARYACADPRTGRMVRYHMHPANVQRAVKYARRKLGIMVIPHELRHAYATHSLDRGVNIKSLQQAMGHKQLETTAGYCHAEAMSVPSPLDSAALVNLPY